MKKLIGILLALAVALPLSGCAAENDTAKNIFDDEITGEISVSCYDTATHKNFLNKAITAFRLKYPGIMVHLETVSALPEFKMIPQEDGTVLAVGTDVEDDQGKLDYINRMNTELMGGSGPDIIAADIIAYDKFAESGALLDMLPLINNDPEFNISDYRENIINAVQYKGGQYIFPMDYYFDFFAYDTSLFTAEQKNILSGQKKFTYEQLIDIVKETFEENGETYLYGFTGGIYQDASFFKYLLDEHYNTFVDVSNKEAHFNDGKFAALLESIEEYCAKGYIRKAAQEEEWDQGSAVPFNSDKRFYFKLESHRSLLQNFDKGMENGQCFYTPLIGNDENDAIAGIVSDSNGDVPFQFAKAYAINSNSDNKRTAWEFIKFLASEEMQVAFELYGNPVHKKALELKTKFEMIEPDYNKWKLTNTVAIPQQKQEVFDNYLACINSFSDMLNTHNPKDSYIKKMIEDEITAYFNGLKSSNEVAQILQNKIELYLNE